MVEVQIVSRVDIIDETTAGCKRKVRKKIEEAEDGNTNRRSSKKSIYKRETGTQYKRKGW